MFDKYILALLDCLTVQLTCFQCHYVHCEWKTTALYCIVNVMKAHNQSSYAVMYCNIYTVTTALTSQNNSKKVS